jgi:two-component system, sensor histidine kinase
LSMPNAQMLVDVVQLNRLFPFYILLNRKLHIESFGKSLGKLCPVKMNDSFQKHFIIKHPVDIDPEFDSILEQEPQLIILESKHNTCALRGQFEYLQDKDCILFAGSPSLSSMNELQQRQLTIHDFAHHDPLIDLLDRLKSHEMINEDTRELLNIVNKQRDELKRISLVASANENGVVFTDATGKIFWINEGFSKLTGFTPEDAIGKTPIELLKGKLSDKAVLNEMVDLFYRGFNFEVEVIHYRKNGSYFCGRVKGQSVLDESGRVTQYFAIVEDVTEQKSNEEALRKSEQRWKFALEGSTDGMWEYDIIKEESFFSPRYKEMLGYTADEFPDHMDEMRKRIHPDDYYKITEIDQQYGAGLIQNHEIEYRLLCKNGDYKWTFNRGMLLKRAADGKPQVFIGVQTDIDRLKKTEQALSATANRLSYLITNMQTGVLVEDQSRQVVLTNKTFCSMFGIDADPKQLIGIDCTQALEQSRFIFKDPEGFSNRIKQLLQQQQIVLEDELELEDGRFLERDYIPIFIDGEYNGHLWKYRDITNRKRSGEKLRRQEEKYRSIIANMNLGLVEVDCEERIQQVNQSFCIMSGYSEQELIGQVASDFFMHGGNKEILVEKNKARIQGHSDAYEIKFRSKQGSYKWWLISGAPLYNDKKELVGSISIHLDITNQKVLEQRLWEAKQDAEHSMHAKEIFLANMSHEIRTPMNAILGMSRQMQKTTLNQQQTTFLHTITTAADNLLVIINDILDFSKIEAGRITLEQIGFSIRDLLINAQNVLRYKAQEKGLALTTYIDKKVEEVLLGDPYRINQVLINLLSNAIKFTEQGKIDVECRLVNERQGYQHLKLTVSDTGIGMDELFMKTLFNKFSQEDESIARRYGGTGLGMSISKQLVELMDGSIEVTSKKGEGTHISIILVLPVGTSNDIPQKEEIKTDASILYGKKILLVEDNEMNRLVANIILQQYGATITEAMNGAEAIDALQLSDFDLVLMDVQMPVLDGREATRIIRQNYNKTIPIIALTANAVKGDMEKCLETGMNDYLTKPYEEEVFISLIAKWLGREIHFETVKEKPVINQPLFNLDMLRKIGEGNDEFVDKMLRIFIQQVPAAVDEIRLAYEAGNIEMVKKIAHRIKPSLGNMGIVSLKEVIEKIEKTSAANHTDAELGSLINKLHSVIEQVVTQLPRQLLVPLPSILSKTK